MNNYYDYYCLDCKKSFNGSSALFPVCPFCQSEHLMPLKSIEKVDIKGGHQ